MSKRNAEYERNPEMFDSEFMCPEIKSYVLSMPDKDVIRTELKLSDPQLHVYIWSPKSSNINHDKMISWIMKCVNLVRQQKWSVYNPKEVWTLTMYLSPLKKTWCSTQKEIGICNVNSGETEFHTGRSIDIHIFRQEDVLKVLLHELCHAHLYDRLIALPASQQLVKNESEALVETNARILYCYLMAVNQESYGTPECVKKYGDLLEEEKKWSQTLVNNLSEYKWNTDTNLMAYYFLTNALLSHYDEFMDWMYKSASRKQLKAEWKGNRDRWWKQTYPNGIHPHGTNDHGDSCFSMKMVKAQTL